VFGKEIVVTVRRRDGRVEVRRVVVNENVGGGQGGDLVTSWAFRLLSCLFAPVSRGATVSFSFVDLDGVSRTQRCIGDSANDIVGSGCTDRAPYIGFGSSSTSPSRTNNRLLGELVRIRGDYNVDESGYSFSIRAYYSFDRDVAVCEVGLYMHVCDTNAVARYLLFDRSVLSPCVNVSAGDAIMVTYVFRF
jgi:hypothetical protein